LTSSGTCGSLVANASPAWPQLLALLVIGLILFVFSLMRFRGFLS